MRARLQTVQHKLASLPVIRWRLWRDERWQKTSLFSAVVWGINFGVLYFGLSHWGHGYWTIIGLNIFWDGVTYFVNKKKFWGDRKVSYVSSGSFTFTASACFMLFHKAILITLAITGIGVIWAQIALAGVGILENPVRYVFNNNFAFAEASRETEMA